MGAFFLFCGLLCGWALACCLFYAALRWAAVHFPGTVTCAGSCALLGWLLIYGEAFSTRSYGSPSPVVWFVPLIIHGLFFAGFGMGVWLLEINTRHALFWWHEVLVCALYFAGAHLALEALIVITLPASAPFHEVVRWNELAQRPLPSMIFVWLFPLGGPLMEFLWRQWRQMQGIQTM